MPKLFHLPTNPEDMREAQAIADKANLHIDGAAIVVDSAAWTSLQSDGRYVQAWIKLKSSTAEESSDHDHAEPFGQQPVARGSRI